jgi:hypothetical protein
MDADLIKRVVSLCVEGLTTDGGHHKQWYLEQILRSISGARYHEFKREHEWEKGIAP